MAWYDGIDDKYAIPYLFWTTSDTFLNTNHLKPKPIMKTKAFFLDRDGTLNVDYNFVHKPEEWTWCNGAISAIRWMKEQNYKIVVVTNQSGISRGRYSVEDVVKLHQWVDEQLAKEDLGIDLWLMAPHHPEYDPAPHQFSPEDRKPRTGMFRTAAEKLAIDFSQSYMAGDKLSDLKPAVELGIKPFFIRSRHEKNQDKTWLKKHNIGQFNSLWEAVQILDEAGF